MKLSATEKLARDICWAGFQLPGPHGRSHNANQYWATITKAAKVGYLDQAAELIWWTRRLGADRLAAAVAEHDKTSNAVPK